MLRWCSLCLQTRSDVCIHELFVTDLKGAGFNIPWYNIIMDWPAITFLTLIGAADINLEFTIGLRKKGSIRQTLFCLPDGQRITFVGYRSRTTECEKTLQHVRCYEEIIKRRQKSLKDLNISGAFRLRDKKQQYKEILYSPEQRLKKKLIR